MHGSSLLKQLLREGQVWLGEGAALSSEREGALFGIPPIDSLSPLPFGCLHEWALENTLECRSKNIWYPPSFVATAVLGQTLFPLLSKTVLQQKSLAAWIGRKIWPTPYVLERTLPNHMWSWTSHSLFVAPKDKEERLWSIIQLLRSPAVFAVLADGSGLNFIATRRIQLAAQKNNALCFLFRPPWELKRNSSAHSKWRITTLNESKTHNNEDNDERWRIELVSSKRILTPLSWGLEWKEGDKNRFHLAEELVPEKHSDKRRKRRA